MRTGMKIMLFVAILVMLFQFAVSAAPVYNTPYTTYNYDPKDNPVASKAGYEPVATISGGDLGITEMANPTDMYVSPDKELYILDNSNNRIIVLNSDYELVREITFKNNGEPMSIGVPDKSSGSSSGIFVDDEEILVADPVQNVVHIFDLDGNLKTQITKPTGSAIISEDFNFVPCKVVKDNAGIIYVLSYGSYNGMLQFDEKRSYEFIGFYGADEVKATAEVLLDYFWKQILPDVASDRMGRTVPVNYLSIDIDPENFIYAVKYETETIPDTEQVKKLNPLGNNILENGSEKDAIFGLREQAWDTVKKWVVSRITDVVYDDLGFITVIDSYQKKIYQYDEQSNLMFVFGGENSTQQGNFSNPVAIESIDDNIIVLDGNRNNITIFKRTDFGALFHEGINLVNEGMYSEAKGIWQEVLKNDSMNPLANSGYGKALLDEGNYEEAMYYLKLGDNRTDYSVALESVRSDILSTIFPIIMVVIILALLAYFIVPRILRKYRKSEYDKKVSKWKYPFHLMAHPINGYTDLKFEKKGSLLVANIILVLFFLVSIIVRQATGYLFNENDLESFNIVFTFLSSVGIFIFFVVAQWAVSVLMDGEGSFKEIWIFTAYALLPYIILMIPVTLLSTVLTLEEAAFFNMFNIIALAWTGLGILLGTREAHQFSMIKTILLLALTIIGMFFVILIIGIVYSMMARLVGFISQIYTELTLR